MPHALIVEDDPNSLSGLSAILAADGFSVDTATTLAEARVALSRFIPDVVLVDLNLPDGSGLDLLQHLPAQPPGGCAGRCGSSSRPPPSGRFRSTSTTSGMKRASAARASTSVAAVSTEKPSADRIAERPDKLFGSSSTIRACGMAVAAYG